ncbi:MAG: RDD family protein [Candidatus Hodarchaeota archaeon]
MAKFCPFCGSEVDQDSIYCLNCGKKLPERVSAPPKRAVSWETTPSEPSYEPGYQPPVTYRPIYQPRPYHPSMKADIGERCVAMIVDGFISGLLNIVCVGVFYSCLKDGIREGQSVGKGLFNMRVIDFNTGLPATYGQSFVRNCLCGWLDGCCCYLVALIDDDGRRIGDQVAGTIVIRDL